MQEDGDAIFDSHSEESGGEMSDVDEGTTLGAMLEDLPDSVTRSSIRLTSKQRMMNLNAYRHAVERALTLELGSSASVPTHFANSVHFIHTQDATGNRKVTEVESLFFN